MPRCVAMRCCARTESAWSGASACSALCSQRATHTHRRTKSGHVIPQVDGEKCSKAALTTVVCVQHEVRCLGQRAQDVALKMCARWEEGGEWCKSVGGCRCDTGGPQDLGQCPLSATGVDHGQCIHFTLMVLSVPVLSSAMASSSMRSTSDGAVLCVCVCACAWMRGSGRHVEVQVDSGPGSRPLLR